MNIMPFVTSQAGSSMRPCKVNRLEHIEAQSRELVWVHLAMA
nr:MAG TPA: adenylosuccinate lyase [Caudoviricetes sp.]